MLRVMDSSVRTIQLHESSQEVSLPVLTLGSGQTLTLAFDRLTDGAPESATVSFRHTNRLGETDLLPTEYDAYLVGSAVYAGRWMKSGRHYVHDHLIELRSKPLWLFSSGPLGEHADPDQAIDHPEEIGTLAGAREHKVFAGRLFRKELGPMERAMAAAVHAPEGDFRDWAEVDAWADHIDAELRELATAHA